MTLRRIATLFLLRCLPAPTTRAKELGDPFMCLPQGLLDLVEQIRYSLGAENPANTTGFVYPVVVPTG